MKAQILSLGTNIICCFPWGYRPALFALEKVPAEYTDQTELQQEHVSFLETTVWCVVEVIRVYFSFRHENIRERCTQGLALNNINNIYIFMKDILQWNWELFFFNCENLALRNTMINTVVWCHCLGSCRVLSHCSCVIRSTAHAFQMISLWYKSKKAKHLSIIFYVVLTLDPHTSEVVELIRVVLNFVNILLRICKR